MKKPFRILLFYFYLIAFCFCLSAVSQTLTVRDIMREPSIAGMRPESEKLSPDGRWVVFAWNADGKEPRNLYLIPAGGGQAQMIVDAEKNFEARTPVTESKLNYGLIVRDDFVKAREKNLGGAEFSPDSKRLLYTQNGDIYVLDLERISGSSELQKESIKIRWRNLESALIRRADLVPNIVKIIQSSSVREQEVFGQVLDAQIQLINAVNLSSKTEKEDVSQQQKENVLAKNEYLSARLTRLISLQELYPVLRSNESFANIQDELLGNENRLKVAFFDYNEVADSASGNKPRRITRTQGAEFAARWLDDQTILYQSSGNFFALNIEKTALVQLSKEANPAGFINVSFAAPTEDAKLLAYIMSDGSKQRALFVPNYLDEFVQSPTFRRGFTEQSVKIVKTDGSLEKAIDVNMPKAEGASYLRNLQWLADGKRLVIDRVDQDTKRRQIFVAQIAENKTEVFLIDEETDGKWIGSLSRTLEPNPKNANQFFFTSERDGWNHIYLTTIDANKFKDGRANAVVKQLTKGIWETGWAKWSVDGINIIYSSTEENPATREFYALDISNGVRMKFPSLRVRDGMRTDAQLAAKEDVLLYKFSRWNQPTELYAQRICTICRGLNFPQKLTESIPPKFKPIKWSEPQFFSFKAKDSKTIPSKIYLPSEFDKSKKYPMVIFVHGAGYLQNVINGWNNYYREFMFHTLLTQKGYIVLDVDYRGSAGYGRDFRTDVYDFLGGLDYEDHLDAINFAVKNYAVDEKRIGVYGGSYGGFMAEMLVMRAPEKIAAAAALRPVGDWKNYFYSSPIYTTERLGFPDKNPEAYKRSSPISYADQLRKPLLILHGLVDDNVPAQDSMQLVEKLIRLEKTEHFEAMFYPSENHGFGRSTSWADEYERILTFFEKHLK